MNILQCTVILIFVSSWFSLLDAFSASSRFIEISSPHKLRSCSTNKLYNLTSLNLHIGWTYNQCSKNKEEKDKSLARRRLIEN